MQFDVVIIGAGPVGLFSVFQAGMLGMKSCVIDAQDNIGGQCSALYPEKPIYDIPSRPEIQAGHLIEQLQIQADPFKPEYLLSRQVNNIEKDGEYFLITTDLGDHIKAKIVLIAAGAGAFGPNKPAIENIELYEGKSVFYFVSEKAKFAGKKIIIAGGGDSAVDWALSLSSIADVTLVHRRAKFRAAPASLQQLEKLVEMGKVKLVVNYQLSGLLGDNGILEKVIVADLDQNEKHLEADILLSFFGLKQNLGPLAGLGFDIELNHIKVSPPYCETNIPGIYAIGDVARYEGKLKLILTGFAESAAALHHGYSKVFNGKALHFEYSTSKGVI